MGRVWQVTRGGRLARERSKSQGERREKENQDAWMNLVGGDGRLSDGGIRLGGAGRQEMDQRKKERRVSSGLNSKGASGGICDDAGLTSVRNLEMSM